MSQTPDEDEDQIFSGKALGEDGALRPAKPIPLLTEVQAAPEAPRAPGTSLLDDPAYEPTVISTPPRVRNVAERADGVELAREPVAPMVSDFAPPPPETPVRYSTPDIRWGRWILRAVVLAAVAAGVAVVTFGKLPSWSGFSFDVLKSEPKKEEVQEKHVATPAPTLLVLSDPAGATVLVGGAEVGVTPWAGDNVWPREPLRIEVRKPGYKPWVGMTMGGQQATLQANLRKR